MDSPQYTKYYQEKDVNLKSFKPYYKWIVLNTEMTLLQRVSGTVLNLIING